MMDYYGSITMTNKDIKASILALFQAHCDWVRDNRVWGCHLPAEYPEDYVIKLSEKLGVYDKTYSVSGWSVFHGRDWVKKMRDILIKEFKDAEKNLAIVKVAIGSPDFPRDMEIARQIASHIQNVA